MTHNGKLDDSRAVNPLIQALKDEDPTVQSSAADALGNLRDPRAVEPLIQTALKDIDSNVRMHATAALGRIDDPRVVELLIKDLKDEDFRVQMRATDALHKINATFESNVVSEKNPDIGNPAPAPSTNSDSLPAPRKPATKRFAELNKTKK